MKAITTKELKELWSKFFSEKGHKMIPSAPLVPENDATVLFTTAGMHPLVPFLLGEKHPAGNRLFSCQKCFRTNDIDEVGDSRHCTFFEMLGNWSLGDYFKKEAISWSYEFLTSEKWLGIPKDRLAVSVFAGDDNSPRDTESATVWEQCGIPKDKIFYLPKKNNWWDLGAGVGPCGPDTEMFYDTGKPACGKDCSPACDCGKYLEIWNDVFMQYSVSAPNGKPVLLKQKNVDTGMGVERTVCVLNGVASVFDTGSFKEAISYMTNACKKDYLSSDENTKAFRIVADHIRASVMLISDGVVPNNNGQSYVLRRLIRRAMNCARKLELSNIDILEVAKIFISAYENDYENVKSSKENIICQISQEMEKFSKTLILGHKEFEKITENLNGKVLDGANAFRLLDTFGFPIELTKEMALEHGINVDEKGFEEAFKEHQEKSRAGSEQLFKGGLADTSNQSAYLHTATHIMLAGLRKLLGENTMQKGSNITPERLRFDFNTDRKLTPEDIKFLEDFVNDVISKEIPVECEVMSLDKARELNAIGVFGSKYGDNVKVYTIKGVDCQICGGPHAKNTKDLVKFKIIKEEACSAGIRRIKAVLLNE
ncbi:MAG: alanine--tRNA ligase [Clostridia bacterium]